MLIVEGTDLVGKSTLCNELIRRLWLLGYPIVYQHFGILPASWDYFEDYISFMNKRVCMDRFIMSEVVYGETSRSGSKISPMKYYELDGYLRVNQSVTVVIVADDSWLHAQYECLVDRSPYSDILRQTKKRKEYYGEEVILKANQGFIDIVDGQTKYFCDYDFVFKVTNEMPSSNNEFVNSIIEKFLKRTGHESLFKKTDHVHSDG